MPLEHFDIVGDNVEDPDDVLNYLYYILIKNDIRKCHLGIYHENKESTRMCY